jgi:TetR/AcrR family transcriptional regulator, copper-responsive repressor
MVQKKSNEEPRRRGRPRAYDPRAALGRVRDTFWETGYSGTSLEEISAATGMNRPSLYAAFGDKHTLYLKALEDYWQLAFVAMREALAGDDRGLDEALMRVYDGQLSIYFSGRGRPRGCFAIGTATTEAVEDPEIRRALEKGLHMLEAYLEARLRTARETGELKDDADPAALAVLASATLHTIAIRARAGVPRTELREIARKAISVICGEPHHHE